MKNNRKSKKLMIILYIFLALVVLGCLYIQTPKFGSLPKGKSLERVQQSPNYKNGEFQNINKTIQITGDKSLIYETFDYLFKSHPNTKPSKPLPTVKTDLKKLNPDENILVWFGHSSYLIQLNGKRFLIDPVFSKSASPFPYSVTAFPGTSIYTPEDMPNIDYLIISHDHWDHLGYSTIKKLNIGKVITGLGVGAHFRRWNFPENNIIEMDWDEELALEKDLKVYCFTTRHFSGRWLKRDQSLWASFIVEAPNYRFYVGGDSGYDSHYKKIGDKFSSIDLVILDSGQYDKGWAQIHEFPNQVIEASKDLKAKALLPVHHSKFTISNHPWNEPLIELSKHKGQEEFNILTPKIGEKVDLYDNNHEFEEWWIL